MVQTLVEEPLAAEATPQVSAALYERTVERSGYRNGSYRRDLNTRFGPIEDLRVPRVQLTDGTAAPAYQTFDRWERRTPDLERAIGQMFVLGISTRKVRGLCAALLGGARFLRHGVAGDPGPSSTTSTPPPRTRTAA